MFNILFYVFVPLAVVIPQKTRLWTHSDSINQTNCLYITPFFLHSPKIIIILRFFIKYIHKIMSFNNEREKNEKILIIKMNVIALSSFFVTLKSNYFNLKQWGITSRLSLKFMRQCNIIKDCKKVERQISWWINNVDVVTGCWVRVGLFVCLIKLSSLSLLNLQTHT